MIKTILIFFLFFFNQALAIESLRTEHSASYLIELLAKGGKVIHITNLETTNLKNNKKIPDNKYIYGCNSKSPVSLKGYMKSIKIKNYFKEKNIIIEKSYSSPSCASIDTSIMLFDKVIPSEKLSVNIDMSKSIIQSINNDLFKKLSKKIEQGKNLAIVTPAINFKEAFNIWPKKPGEMYIYEPIEDGEFIFLGALSFDKE